MTKRLIFLLVMSLSVLLQAQVVTRTPTAAKANYGSASHSCPVSPISSWNASPGTVANYSGTGSSCSRSQSFYAFDTTAAVATILVSASIDIVSSSQPQRQTSGCTFHVRTLPAMPSNDAGLVGPVETGINQTIDNNSSNSYTITNLLSLNKSGTSYLWFAIDCPTAPGTANNTVPGNTSLALTLTYSPVPNTRRVIVVN